MAEPAGEVVFIGKDGKRLSPEQAASLKGKDYVDARERGIRTATQAKERTEWQKATGATTPDEAREVTELRKRPTLTEERKYGAHKFWQGIGTGALAALVVTSLVFVLIIRQMTHMAFEEAQQATQQGALIGAAAANQDPRSHERTVPHLDVP